MLALFRRFLNTWAARLFFLILVAAFGVWGVGDVIRNLGGTTAVATVGGQRIELPQVQEAFQQQMNQLNRMLGGRIQPTEDMRRSAARQALDQLVTQAAIAQEEQRLRLAVPDGALRQAVFSMPGLRGPNGQFDRAKFENILRSNNLTEARFLELMRGDLAERQLMEAVGAGATAPDTLVRRLFDFRGEKRVAQTVVLPFAAAPEPPAPTDAELHRWYDNHPDLYSAPEYRRIKAVILAPDTVAKEVPVSDAGHPGLLRRPQGRLCHAREALGRGAGRRRTRRRRRSSRTSGNRARTGTPCRRRPRRRTPPASRSTPPPRASSPPPTSPDAVFAATPERRHRPGADRRRVGRASR